MGQSRPMPSRSNMKFDEQEELVNALKEQIKLEKELEDAKLRLANM